MLPRVRRRRSSRTSAAVSHGAADSHGPRGFHDAVDSHEARGSHDPDPVLGQQRPGPAEFAVVGEETPLVSETALMDECPEPLEGSFALDGGPAAFAQ